MQTDRYGGSDIDALLDIPLMLLALLGFVASLLDLAAQLVALPFVVLARTVRLAPWPVQLDKADKHVRTLWVRGFARAGRLRDEQMAAIRAGTADGGDLVA